MSILREIKGFVTEGTANVWFDLIELLSHRQNKFTIFEMLEGMTPSMSLLLASLEKSQVKKKPQNREEGGEKKETNNSMSLLSPQISIGSEVIELYSISLLIDEERTKNQMSS